MTTSFNRICACTLVLSPPEPAVGHTSARLSWHSQASMVQSFMSTLFLSPGSWCTQYFVCALLHVLNSHWPSVLHMVMCMFQYYSLKSSHPLRLPLSPKVCSLCLFLLCCPACWIIGTIFLNSIYMCLHIQYLSHSFWLTSLCITSSRFIHLIRVDPNIFLFIVK